MTRILTLLLFVLVLGISTLFFPSGAVAVLACGVFAVPAVVIIQRAGLEDRSFLLQTFLAALLLRMLFAALVQFFDMWTFFALDSEMYHTVGKLLANAWHGDIVSGNVLLKQYVYDTSQTGWGILYFVASIYFFTGPNMLAAQLVIAVFGAALAPLMYVCALHIFNNRKVARITAWIIVFFPSLIIWTSLLLKDGIIIFLLVLSVISVIRLQEKFNYTSLALLILSLSGTMTLRFYIFFMLAAAVVGSFVVNTSDMRALVRRVAVVVIAGVSLTYFGILRNADKQLIQMTDLQRIQQSRKDLAESANSGFGRDLDVSTTEGALTALPIGFSYLMFAPFPWQISNLRQIITMPENMLWWCSMPFLIMGLLYTKKYRLKQSIAILLFILMLTLAYSILQGNVGTAYRHRAQIQIFYFMFIAVGYTVWQERKENQHTLDQIQSQRNVHLIQAGRARL